MVFTLETIVEKFGEEMAPYAVGLCQHLTQAFWRLQVGGQGALQAAHHPAFASLVAPHACLLQRPAEASAIPPWLHCRSRACGVPGFMAAEGSKYPVGPPVSRP